MMNVPRMPVFAYGFRIFFLLSGLLAPLALVCWLAFLFFGHRLPSHIDPFIWHAHEMLFGFTGAMVAGFLLTAVPNWTGEKAAHGAPLGFLAALWIASRVLLVGPWTTLASVVDLAFLPCLFLLLFPPLLRKGERKILIFVPVLVTLWIGNLMMHLQMLGWAVTARTGITLAVTVILLLLTMISGRILPFFTTVALGGEARRWAWVDGLAVLGTLAYPFVELASVRPEMVVCWGAITGSAHLLRLWGWSRPGVFRMPLLWVLYTGYGWLIIGFYLRAASALGWVDHSAALHAFTVGSMGVMGLGVMARASLGHTGRPLQPARLTVFSFLILNVSALLRVLGPTLDWPREMSYALPGVLWCLAFIFFLWVYAPILLSPRADGKPG